VSGLIHLCLDELYGPITSPGLLSKFKPLGALKSAELQRNQGQATIQERFTTTTSPERQLVVSLLRHWSWVVSSQDAPALSRRYQTLQRRNVLGVSLDVFLALVKYSFDNEKGPRGNVCWCDFDVLLLLSKDTEAMPIWKSR
jgi:hypothetical protein